MKQKKVCLLGAFSVGKTSLIRRFIESVFDDRYITTVGVKVDKKVLEVDGEQIMLMIWDLAGEDDYSALQTAYLRGAAGCIYVVDGTRPATLETVISIRERTEKVLGDVPFVLAINKADLESDWLLPGDTLASLNNDDAVFKTSALTGLNVEALFSHLVGAMA